MKTFNKSSWFPLKNFTRTGCHFDWMLGATKFVGANDFLTGKIIPTNSTVFWNRTFKASVSLDSYNEARKNNDAALIEKCRKIGLPMDVRV